MLLAFMIACSSSTGGGDGGEESTLVTAEQLAIPNDTDLVVTDGGLGPNKVPGITFLKENLADATTAMGAVSTHVDGDQTHNTLDTATAIKTELIGILTAAQMDMITLGVTDYDLSANAGATLTVTIPITAKEGFTLPAGIDKYTFKVPSDGSEDWA